MANLCNCKLARPEGSGTTWYYVCKLTGKPTDPVICRKCADREPQRKDGGGNGLKNGSEMADKKTVRFPSYNVSLGEAILVVKHQLDDPGIALPSKVLAIEHVANMETHNSITKDDLVGALRWLFQHYDFEEE